MSDKLDIISLPYADRQLIALSRSETFKSIRSEFARSQTEIRKNQIEALDRISNGRLKKFMQKVSNSQYYSKGKDLYTNIKSFDQNQNISEARSTALSKMKTEVLVYINGAHSAAKKVNYISRDQASALVFPIGHPREGIIYVGHPAIPNVYYTLAEFHRRVFEHKLAEAIRLLISLGATTISAEHISGWKRNFSTSLSIPLPNIVDKTIITGEHNSGINSSILFTASLPGNTTPRIPINNVWYQHEPSWISIADARIEYNLQDFSISVFYQDDFGINAALKSSAAGSGLSFGGKFEQHESTIWKLEGKFLSKQIFTLSDKQ